MYINNFFKFLIIFFFNILFSSVVLSDESKSFFIEINTADEFVLSCNDYIDNEFRDSNKYTKISNIIKLLKKKYDLPANVLNDHKVLFENKEPQAITLFFNENNEDITDEVIEAIESKKNNVFCFSGDSNNIPGDYAIIKLSPVTFFSLTCTEPNLRISKKEMTSELQKILPDFNENDLISDIYNYSGGLNNQNGELFCNKLKPETKFFYKKLANSSELILNQDSTNIKDNFSEIKQNCDVLPDDILETSVTDGSREDCIEELNKRNNFKNEINFNLKKLEKLENIYN
ncbi:hypothetical protein N8761_00825, partial [Alphaproteobacteria bacterium]|nr:hypothetical protein [Alphaproteobacteria bacterium]